jgi:hypothetical protein
MKYFLSLTPMGTHPSVAMMRGKYLKNKRFGYFSLELLNTSQHLGAVHG